MAASRINTFKCAATTLTGTSLLNYGEGIIGLTETGRRRGVAQRPEHVTNHQILTQASQLLSMKALTQMRTPMIPLRMTIMLALPVLAM